MSSIKFYTLKNKSEMFSPTVLNTIPKHRPFLSSSNTLTTPHGDHECEFIKEKKKEEIIVHRQININ